MRSYLYSQGGSGRLGSQQQYNSRVAAKANTHAQVREGEGRPAAPAATYQATAAGTDRDRGLERPAAFPHAFTSSDRAVAGCPLNLVVHHTVG